MRANRGRRGRRGSRCPRGGPRRSRPTWRCKGSRTGGLHRTWCSAQKDSGPPPTVIALPPGPPPRGRSRKTAAVAKAERLRQDDSVIAAEIEPHGEVAQVITAAEWDAIPNLSAKGLTLILGRVVGFVFAVDGRGQIAVGLGVGSKGFQDTRSAAPRWSTSPSSARRREIPRKAGPAPQWEPVRGRGGSNAGFDPSWGLV